MKAKGPGESSILLLDVIQRLNKHRIPYIIVGALAASFYGVVRASLDADAVISLSDREERCDHLVAELKKAGLKVSQRKPNTGDPVLGVINIEDKFHNRVDLLLGIRGMDKDVFKRRHVAYFMGKRIHIASAEDFIAMKIFAGSVKDIDDARHVLEVSKEKINRSLCRKLTLRYGKRELAKLETILKRSS